LTEGNDNQKKPMAERFLALGKDAVALSRDAVLILIFLLLVFIPEFVNNRLSEAGFEKGEFLGLTWKAQAKNNGDEAQKLSQQLGDAQVQIARQAEQLKKNAAELSRLRSSPENTGSAVILEKLGRENADLASDAAKIDRAITAQMQAATPVLRQARSILDGSKQWAIVMGGDRNIEAASYEIKWAKRSGLTNAIIYYKQGSYRSVAVLDRGAAIEPALQIARQRRSDAYVVDLARWCSSPVQRSEYFECL
jgi:hypothetical protein